MKVPLHLSILEEPLPFTSTQYRKYDLKIAVHLLEPSVRKSWNVRVAEFSCSHRIHVYFVIHLWITRVSVILLFIN